MSLSPEISAVLTPIQNLFTAPTWHKVQVLLLGTLLARGRRTVTAALRQMGLGDAPGFSSTIRCSIAPVGLRSKAAVGCCPC
jgi:hypothetical protein